jgi:hypothetical protein
VKLPGAGIGTLRWSFFAGNHLEACRLLEIVAAYRKLAHERAARLKLSLGHNQNKESPAVAGLSVRRNVEPENRTCGYRSTDSRLALPLRSRCDSHHKNAFFTAHCVAEVVGLELRNVVANYLFEKSRRFAGIQPNSGHRDYSRLSCGVGQMQLGSKMPRSIGRLSASALSHRGLSSAVFIANIAESDFRHTQGADGVPELEGGIFSATPIQGVRAPHDGRHATLCPG